MQMLGIRVADGLWSWVLCGADGVVLVRSARTFGSYALAMVDAACVHGQLQTAEIECADHPLRNGVQRER